MTIEDVKQTHMIRDRDHSAFGRDVGEIIAEAEAGQIALRGFTKPRKTETSDAQLHVIHSEGQAGEDVCEPTRLSELGSLVPWQWVMFAEPANGGVAFLGVFVTRALSRDDAVLKAYVAGCCPGGRAEAVILPAELLLEAKDCDRLLTMEECEALRDRLRYLLEGAAIANC